MRIAVCVKQIPDPIDPYELDNAQRLHRDRKLILDDSDIYGVEMALQLVDRSQEGEAILVSMAPNGETNGLRTALAMGASGAILVSDPGLEGSDALATAKVLAAAIRRENPDLIFTATESTDGYTGTVSAQIAELLGLPSITFAKSIELDGSSVRVRRQTLSGYDETTCELPAVISVTAGVVEPRYPSMRGIIAAKSKPVTILTLSDLGIDPSTVGLRGSRQELISVANAQGRAGGEIIVDDGQGFKRVVAYLEQLKVI